MDGRQGLKLWEGGLHVAYLPSFEVG